MLLLAVLLLSSTLTQAAPVSTTVQLRGDFFGAAFDTPLRVEAAPPMSRDALGLLDADRRALAPLARWVDRSAAAVGLDDYGRFRLVVSAIDALPVRLTEVGGGRRTVSEAIDAGTWTSTDRLLAIGGGLRAVGFDVNVFVNAQGHTLLGLRSADADLNVNAVHHKWETLRGGRRSQVQVSWVLWDGVRPVGRLAPGALRGVKAQDRAQPTGRPLHFGDRTVPGFALRRSREASMALAGTGRTLRYTRQPDAASYLALFPELRFADQVGLARAELHQMGLDEAIRRATRDAPDEVALIDALIRTLQQAFVYEPGPVRSMHELAATGHGDCDQLSLMLAALLIEVGYGGDDVVAVQWDDHLGLAVRARNGQGPPGGTGVDLDGGRYHLVDVTHYAYENGRLASRWGRTSPEHGRRVEIVPLDVGEAR